MIILITLLFITGIFAILLEAVLPFGISATVGLLIIAGSGYGAVYEFGWTRGLLYCILALTVAIVVTRLTLRSGLRAMRLAPPPPRKVAPGSAAARSQEPAVDPQAGERAVVVQPLRPIGTIEWKGHRLPAKSHHPEHITQAGTAVTISGKDSVYWIVEEIEEET